MKQDRKQALYAALVRSADREKRIESKPGEAMKVPLAKGNMRKRLAAAEQAGDATLASELRRLLDELERAFPD